MSGSFVDGDSGLLNEPAARIEDVADGAGEDAHLKTVEGDLDAVSASHRARRGGSKDALEAARAIGMAGREVEEFVEAAAAFAGLGAVDRDGVLHDGLAVHLNGGDERPRGFEIERRLPMRDWSASCQRTTAVSPTLATATGPGLTPLRSRGTGTAKASAGRTKIKLRMIRIAEITLMSIRT